MHFQDSFNNNYAKPMCSGEMKTRWWVFRADKNPTNRLLCCLSVTFLVCCVNAATSLQRALWPASKRDGGWRAGAVAAQGACPPNLPFQGPASLPFLPSIGSRRENWPRAFLGGAVGEGSGWEQGPAWLLSALGSKKVWVLILRKNPRLVPPVEPVPWLTLRGSC